MTTATRTPPRRPAAEPTALPSRLTSASRIVLAWVLGIVAGTALAGGIMMVIGSVVPGAETTWQPPLDYLQGSPFGSYFGPGLLLAAGVGGLHLAAFIQTVRRQPSFLLLAVICGYELVIFIFVEMIIIPFSMLQVMFAALGLTEIGLALVALGLFSSSRRALLHHAGASDLS